MLDWWRPDGRFSLLALVLLGVPAIAAIVFMISRLAHRLDRHIFGRRQRLDRQPGPPIPAGTIGFFLLIIGVCVVRHWRPDGRLRAIAASRRSGAERSLQWLLLRLWRRSSAPMGPRGARSGRHCLADRREAWFGVVPRRLANSAWSLRPSYLLVPFSATWVLFALSGIAKELQPSLASRELVWSLVGGGIDVLLLGFLLGQLVMC